ncbi:uncharacterized protein N7482_004895 [Penicillium canariense]|uniref:Uncharacterized protein n=1 Tax=Penicillium canariense TaxID=189055 RepID=A0A9W9I402_9EURO|nr:uncharacterized protein N7482_004895 [Penicillium canariense]KAJ5166114.1 hypothetical protein N7482_004895 [Penicillium canariense]
MNMKPQGCKMTVLMVFVTGEALLYRVLWRDSWPWHRGGVNCTLVDVFGTVCRVVPTLRVPGAPTSPSGSAWIPDRHRSVLVGLLGTWVARRISRDAGDSKQQR